MRAVATWLSPLYIGQSTLSVCQPKGDERESGVYIFDFMLERGDFVDFAIFTHEYGLDCFLAFVQLIHLLHVRYFLEHAALALGLHLRLHLDALQESVNVKLLPLYPELHDPEWVYYVIGLIDKLRLRYQSFQDVLSVCLLGVLEEQEVFVLSTRVLLQVALLVLTHQVIELL